MEECGKREEVESQYPPFSLLIDEVFLDVKSFKKVHLFVSKAG